MPEIEVVNDVGIRDESVGMQIAERGGLDRAAEKQLVLFDGVGEVSDEDITNFVFGGIGQDKAERALGVVMANENDRTVKERPAKLSAIQKQLAPEGLEYFGHTVANNLPQACGDDNGD